MISTAEPRTVAGKITAIHNRHKCRVCRRPIEGGVLTFGLSGSDARWYPDRETAERLTRGPRYIFPVRDDDVSLDDVLRWIDTQRDELDQLAELVEREREERRMARAYRADQSGWRASAWPCDDCGYPKRRPADRCDRCGDEPVPIGIDPHEHNRARGYRD
jgi:hypothetical protein